MGASLIGFVVGLALGAATGTEGAAYGGAMIGLFLGAMIHAVGWVRTHLGDAPVVERHRVMCTPFGHAAELELVGDLERGRWFDVRRCSLMDEPSHVDCDKGCVQLANRAGLVPGRACSCQLAAAAPREAHRPALPVVR